MELNSLLIFAAALMMAVGSPGPSIAALVSRVLAKGWRDALPFLAAMWIGEIAWLTLAIVGLAALAETYSVAFVVLKWLGVFYLLWLAYHMWSSSTAETTAQVSGVDPMAESTVRGGGAWRMFGAGMLITAGNPKIMVFYVALLPTLLDMTAITVSGWASLALVALVVIGTIDTSYVVLAHKARQVLLQPERLKWVNRSCASVMAGAAAFIAVRS